MPPILAYFSAGLVFALGAAAVCYFTVGHASTPLWQSLFGPVAGQLWGRLFRLTLLLAAVAGALSTKFYGCHGPTDYQRIAESRDQLLQRTTEQAAGALDHLTTFLLLTAALSAAVFAALRANPPPPSSPP